MSDAVDVQDDTEIGQDERSFLPPPTFPAGMLDADDASGDGADRADGADPLPEASPPLASAPAGPPERQNMLIRLGHRLCGFR